MAKKNESIWHLLTAGLDVNNKTLYWYEMCPGVGFKAVSFGRTRSTWFNGTEYLIAYRNSLNSANPYIVVDWVNESLLVKRH
jgi:hypothetical protein